MKIALGIEYNGQNYHGWQRQKNSLPTIQGYLEFALAKVANHSVHTFCAGRTDAGVHATGQVIHFDSEVKRPISAWLFGTNTHLPKDIRVLWAKLVPEEFHARFSATARQYRYVICNQTMQPAIFQPFVTFENRGLDIQRMQQAANFLLGEQDFSSFRSKDCQSKSPKRHVMHIFIEKKKNLVIIDIKANAFLHHMVRNIVGVLLPIGLKFKDPFWAQEVLQAKNRTKAGVTAPGTGLFLVTVDYPEKYELPKCNEPWF